MSTLEDRTAEIEQALSSSKSANELTEVSGFTNDIKLLAHINGEIKQMDWSYLPSGSSGWGPDNEDINLHEAAPGTYVNRLKDRDAVVDGKKGYKIIRSNFDFTNIPTDYANSIWEIRYSHDLGANTITLPANVTLKFEGGVFSNGTITGNNTKIKADLTKLFDNNLTLNGTWRVNKFPVEWAGAQGDWLSNSQAISKIYNIEAPILIQKGEFILDDLHLTGKETLTVYCDGVVFKRAPDDSHVRGVDNMLLIENTNQITFVGDFKLDGNHLNAFNGNVWDWQINFPTASYNSLPFIKFNGDIEFSNSYYGCLRIFSTQNGFDTVSFKDIFLNDTGSTNGGVFSIRGGHNVISIQNIISKNYSNRLVNVNGGGKLIGISQEASYINQYNTTQLNINSVVSNNAKDMVLFVQNVFNFDINAIICRDALYNEDGTDSYCSSFGWTFLKFDYADSVTGDYEERTGRIGSLICSNTNRSTALLTPTGANAGSYRRFAWLDEGLNNVNIDSIEVDMPIIQGDSYTRPKFSTGFTVNKLVQKYNPSSSPTLISGIINTLIIEDGGFIQLKDTTVNNLICRGIISILTSSLSEIEGELNWRKLKNVEYGVTINRGTIDHNKIISIEFNHGLADVSNRVGRCAFLKLNINNVTGGKWRIITSDPLGLYNITSIRERLEINIFNSIIKDASNTFINLFTSESLNNWLLKNTSTVSGGIDLTDTGTYAPYSASLGPSTGLTDLPPNVLINASRLENSILIGANQGFNVAKGYNEFTVRDSFIMSEQVNSTATDVAGLVADFNSLLSKLKTGKINNINLMGS